MHAFFPLGTPSQFREARDSAVRRRHHGRMDVSPLVSKQGTPALCAWLRRVLTELAPQRPAASPTSLLTAMRALRRGFERARLRSEKHSNGTVFAPRPPTFRRHPADIGLYYIYKRHVQNAAASERPPTKADKSRHWPIRAKPAPPAPVSPHPPARVPHWPTPSRAA